MTKERVDLLMVSKGLAESQDLAKRLIMAGKVKINGHVFSKAGLTVDSDSHIELETPPKYVSRGGFKLEAALKNFHVDVNGRVCADIGASTGGFTDCLLQNGAKKVYSFDVGKGQLHWKLTNDSRVHIIDDFNARTMTGDIIPEKVDLATIDVSFISLTMIMPAAVSIMNQGGVFLVLIKPQFEAERQNVEKGGVVRDSKVHQQVVDKITTFAVKEMNLHYHGVCESPITGPAGNVEFLAHFQRD